MSFVCPRYRTNKRQQGSAMLELAFSTMLICMMALFALDIGVALLCYGNLDRTARDATRAAAQGSSRAEAQKLATAAMRNFAMPEMIVSAPQVIEFRYNDFGGIPPAGQSPFVTIALQSRVKVPAPIFLFGADIPSSPVFITRRYTFPIVRLSIDNVLPP